MNSYKDNESDCFESIYPNIYYAEVLLSGFVENYFNCSPEAFRENNSIQTDFISNYEYMAAQIIAIKDILFRIRLKSEFAMQEYESPFVQAHIRNKAEMQS